MTITTDGRSFIWAVFDADGCECETLSAVFENEEQAADFAVRLRAAAEAEDEELYRGRGYDWKPTIKRIISVRSLELGLEPDIHSTLRLLREGAD
jgi:hypothetical protein